MRCENCGMEIDENLKTCPGCGWSAETRPAEAELAQPEVVVGTESNTKILAIVGAILSTLAFIPLFYAAVTMVIRDPASFGWRCNLYFVMVDLSTTLGRVAFAIAGVVIGVKQRSKISENDQKAKRMADIAVKVGTAALVLFAIMFVAALLTDWTFLMDLGD